MNLREYTKLKDRADSLQREADREEGALEQVRKSLSALGCEAVKDAEKQLVRLQKEEDKLSSEYESAFAQLLSDFPQLGE